jgi:hypothetical protein
MGFGQPISGIFTFVCGAGQIGPRYLLEKLMAFLEIDVAKAKKSSPIPLDHHIILIIEK